MDRIDQFELECVAKIQDLARNIATDLEHLREMVHKGSNCSIQPLMDYFREQFGFTSDNPEKEIENFIEIMVNENIHFREVAERCKGQNEFQVFLKEFEDTFNVVLPKENPSQRVIDIFFNLMNTNEDLRRQLAKKHDIINSIVIALDDESGEDSED
jgi:hypothetical protein